MVGELLVLSALLPAAAGALELSGMVADRQGSPVEGATVRVQTRPLAAISGPDGTYHLLDPEVSVGSVPILITVGKPGYATGERLVMQDQLTDLVLQLRSPEPDDPNEDLKGLSPQFCRLCHEAVEGQVDLYGQSERSRHANSGRNPWVGAVLRDFRQRHPNESGFCVECHAPGALIQNKQPGGSDLSDPTTADFLAYDPDEPDGPRTHGVQCVTCHRVKEVNDNIKAFNFAGNATLDKSSGPLQVHGPWDDVVEMHAVPNPVYTQSLYCATCHEYERPADIGRPAVPGQSTYTEWLDYQARLPADSPLKGKATCQFCHMPASTLAEPQYASSLLGPPRNPAHQPIRDHTFLGTTLGPGESVNMLDGVAGLNLQVAQTGASEIEVSVQLTNLLAGHKLPTGVELRNMLLLVEAWDAAGRALEPIEGRNSMLPWWTGTGTGPEDVAGRPGKGYTKFLTRSREHYEEPENQFAEIVEAECVGQDNRIDGRLSDTSSYVFRLSGTPGPVTVLARVVYRRAPAGLTEKLNLPRTDGMGNPLAEFEMARSRLQFVPEVQLLSGTVALDFATDATGAPFQGSAALADNAFAPLGLLLSSRASSACPSSTSDGHAYAVERPQGGRVLAPAPQVAHNECDGGILRLDFPSPVGHVSLEVEPASAGAGFDLRALDSRGREVAIQNVYDEAWNCALRPAQGRVLLHLDHHGIAAIEARGLVRVTSDRQVMWSVRRLEYRFDSFHPLSAGPVATPTPGPPTPTPTITPTPRPPQPLISERLSPGLGVVSVGGLWPPGARVEIRTLGGSVLGAGTADENGNASVWLIRPLSTSESVIAIDLRTGLTSQTVVVGAQVVDAPWASLIVGFLACTSVLPMVRRAASRALRRRRSERDNLS